MTTKFIHQGVWTQIGQAARKSRRPADVAVAYFGKGAAKLLPLKPGSRLVVDASEASVKAGQSCPADLLRLQERRVRIFNVQNLHAKVFVFGKQAFVGSSNVSQRSSVALQEAVVQTTDRTVVSVARDFVRSLCLQELGPEALERLKKLYRPPRIAGQRSRRRRSPHRVVSELSRMRLVTLIPSDFPPGSESTEEEGYQDARMKLKHQRTHFVDGFQWPNKTIRTGESIMQIVDEGDGPAFVSPPGDVINTRHWSNGRRQCTFVYLEVPRVRRIRANKLAKRLGRGAAKRLKRSGRVNADFAQKLREAFQR